LEEAIALPLETLHWSAPSRPFLVCVRSAAGPPAWVDFGRARSWDLLLSYYEQPIAFEKRAEMSTRGGLTKFTALWETNRQHDNFLFQYQATLFLDDDIEIRFEDVDALFSIARDFQLALAQPSLSSESSSSWPITLRCPSFRLRFTNFVEIMAPLFSREALERCLETFHESISGWGLDLVWPAILGHPRDAIAIIDEIEITHTRPVDPVQGRFYRYLRDLGVDPYRELEELTRRYDVPADLKPQQYGAVLSPMAKAEGEVPFTSPVCADRKKPSAYSD
jgi:hypothetical protein